MKLTVLMENVTCCDDILHEHGLSLYIEVNGRKLLFDTGQSGSFAENAIRLGVDLSQVDTAILSHGHYDHGGGLSRFLELNDHAPIYVQKDAFQPHYHGESRYIGLDPTLASSGRMVPTGDETDLGDGLSLATCNALAPAYPLDSAGLTVKEGEAFLPEDFRHEQYLLIEEHGKKLLISGCSHKGILNLVNWYKPDYLVGGFHFMGIDPDTAEGQTRLDQAAEVLLSFPTRYWTCHCTGRRPYAYLKERMGTRLSYLSAGDRLHLF